MKTQDTYGEVITIKRPGIVARVHIPVLTEGERERRMKVIGKAAVQMLQSTKK